GGVQFHNFQAYLALGIHHLTNGAHSRCTQVIFSTRIRDSDISYTSSVVSVVSEAVVAVFLPGPIPMPALGSGAVSLNDAKLDLILSATVAAPSSPASSARVTSSLSVSSAYPLAISCSYNSA